MATRVECEDGTTCRRGACDDEWMGSTADLPVDDGDLTVESCGP